MLHVGFAETDITPKLGSQSSRRHAGTAAERGS